MFTARAGAAGIALSFCSGDERTFLRDIEKLTRVPLRTVPLPANLPAPSRSEMAEHPAERPFARGFKSSAPRQNGGRADNGARARSAPVNGPRSAPVNGQRAPAGHAAGLPAFLRRDGAGRRPSSGPVRQRGAGRGA